MNARNIIATLPLFGLLAALSPSSVAAEAAETPAVRSAAGDTATGNDPRPVLQSYEDESSRTHEAVAKHHEDVAKALQVKIQEQKQLIEHYEEKGYTYGRQAQDLQAHAEALVRKYEMAARTNLEEAALHRQMALKLKVNNGKSS